MEIYVNAMELSYMDATEEALDSIRIQQQQDDWEERLRREEETAE